MRYYMINNIVLMVVAIFACACFFSPELNAKEIVPTHMMIISGFDQPGDFQEPMGIFFDNRSSEIYFADTGNARICVFSNEGMPLVQYRVFKEAESHVSFRTPLDVAVDSEGVIFVSDIGLGRVIGMDFLGNKVVEIDLSKADGSRISAYRIAIDSEDNLFITDSTNNQILVYTTKGRYRYKFGKQSGGVTGITKVDDVYPDRENSLIYVTSFQGDSVMIFDYDGYQIRAFGVHDSGEPNFSLPTGIVATPDGYIYVADMLRSDVKKFTKDGVFISRFGGLGKSQEAIIYPADIAISKDGRLFFAEKQSGRLHIFSSLPEGADNE